MKKTKDIIFESIPALLSFLLPFGGFLSVLIIVWFITAWFCFDRDNAREGLRNKWFWIVTGFFFLHCLSALLSDNQQAALTSIEIKLSFLAFPYFLFLYKFDGPAIKRIFTAFVSGCGFALIACLVRAALIFMSRGENFFFYNSFSWFIHTGYFSMYMLFGIVIVQLGYPDWSEDNKNGKTVRYFFTALFSLGIFLCASKIGFIAYAIVMILLSIIKFKKYLNFKTAATALVIIGVLLFTLYKLAPSPFMRLRVAMETATSGSIDKTSGESTAVRILIWEQCVDIIKENFLLGVGSGDANDVLQKKYEESGMTGAREHNLNAHNEFFQTFIGLGIIGFIVLALITFGTLVWGVMKRNVFLVLFSIIIILNFSVESMLQTQAGNLFYVYFLCLLLKYNIPKLSPDNHQK